jgi:MoaA/NifB/PqqE/SkfB family radical SAM enzyme
LTVEFDQPVESSSDEIEFLWLELTNRCNLRCVHCYADSGPHGYKSDRLLADDYRRLVDEARELGCDQVQFIGGEPTLNRDLPELIDHARGNGYSFVEVFTNLTYFPDSLLRCFRNQGVSVASRSIPAEARHTTGSHKDGAALIGRSAT